MKNKRKLLIALVGILFTGLFSSCTKGNDELIIGSWLYEIDGYPTVWTFSENGNFIINAGDISQDGVYWINEEILVLSETDGDIIGAGTFKLSIEKLNRKELILSVEDVRLEFTRL